MHATYVQPPSEVRRRAIKGMAGASSAAAGAAGDAGYDAVADQSRYFIVFGGQTTVGSEPAAAETASYSNELYCLQVVPTSVLPSVSGKKPTKSPPVGVKAVAKTKGGVGEAKPQPTVLESDSDDEEDDDNVSDHDHRHGHGKSKGKDTGGGGGGNGDSKRRRTHARVLDDDDDDAATGGTNAQAVDASRPPSKKGRAASASGLAAGPSTAAATNGILSRLRSDASNADVSGDHTANFMTVIIIVMQMVTLLNELLVQFAEFQRHIVRSSGSGDYRRYLHLIVTFRIAGLLPAPLASPTIIDTGAITGALRSALDGSTLSTRVVNLKVSIYACPHTIPLVTSTNNVQDSIESLLNESRRSSDAGNTAARELKELLGQVKTRLSEVASAAASTAVSVARHVIRYHDAP
jgi:hypothetical protein